MPTPAFAATACAASATLGFDNVGQLIAARENLFATGLGLEWAFVANTALAKFIIGIVRLLALPAPIALRAGLALFTREVASGCAIAALPWASAWPFALPAGAALARRRAGEHARAPGEARQDHECDGGAHPELARVVKRGAIEHEEPAARTGALRGLARSLEPLAV